MLLLRKGQMSKVRKMGSYLEKMMIMHVWISNLSLIQVSPRVRLFEQTENNP